MWRQRLEWCVYKSRNSKVSWKHPKARWETKDRFSFRASKRNQASLTTRVWPSGLQSWQRMNYCGLWPGGPRKRTQVEAPQEGGCGGSTERHRKTFEMMDMFITFTVVMVSRVFNMSELKLYTLNMHSLSYVNYISIKPIKKSKVHWAHSQRLVWKTKSCKWERRLRANKQS